MRIITRKALKDFWEHHPDYEAALQEIGRLLSAAPGTPEDSRLEVLSTLVWAYEEEHYPIPDPDPIEFIKYEMECRGLGAREHSRAT